MPANVDDLVLARARAEEAERQAQKLDLVNRISLLLSSQLDLQEILDLAAREAVRLFWADHVGIMLLDDSPNGKDVWGTIVAEYPPGQASGLRLNLSSDPIMEEFCSTGRPVYIQSIETDPLVQDRREYLHQLGIVSFMAFPLISRDRIIGSIQLGCYTHCEFSETDQELLLSVAISVAAAVQHARLFAAEQEARKTADTLREVARVLSSTFDPNEVLQLILSELQKVIYYDSASIMLQNREKLRIAAFLGLDDVHTHASHTVFLPSERRAGWWVVQHGLPLVIPDTCASPYWAETSETVHIRSWLGVPLIFKGRVLGVLNINAYQPGRFTTKDSEVAMIFANHAAVALENARLYQESLGRIERELAIARQIQFNLFPRSLPSLAGMKVGARCVPARETGGDFYDVFELKPRHLALMVGDASGKSISGAMLMMIARSIARSEAGNEDPPALVLRRTNRGVARDIPPNAFVAFSYASIDLDRHRLALANAGQMTPIRRMANGDIEYLDVPGPTFPLGINPYTPYEGWEIALDPGDMLVFYTDGVVEAHDDNHNLFGFDRLEMLIRRYGSLAPDAFIERVMQSIHEFTGSNEQHDDITLVVVRVGDLPYS
jgi:serine phosphatase RsbU (regulator of sigma subunit)